METKTLPLETTTKVSVGQLRLDRDNPRLLGEAKDSPDEAIIARLYRSADLNELLASISTNGYLDIEPLVVTTHPDTDELIVLEGNRRLATLRLLREPDLVDRIAQLQKVKITIPRLDDDSLRSTFDCVSVYPVASRERARSFIGFKHINGPAKWTAYAKARFAADWYKTRTAEHGTLEDIARAIGDRHDTIKRMVSAIYVLDQARANDLFEVRDRNIRKFNFSHLYTALSRSQYMNYLGLDYTWARYTPVTNPVPPDKLDRLRKILVWIYGSKKDDVLPVVKTQNPDIKRLGEVLDNNEGRLVLEVTCDLDAAYTTTVPVDSQFAASLIRARSSIRNAAGTLRA